MPIMASDAGVTRRRLATSQTSNSKPMEPTVKIASEYSTPMKKIMCGARQMKTRPKTKIFVMRCSQHHARILEKTSDAINICTAIGISTSPAAPDSSLTK